MKGCYGIVGIALGALWALGCQRVDIEVDPTIRIAEEIPTVVSVEWPVVSQGATGALVEFGPDSSYGRLVPAEIGDDGVARATLLGLKQDTEYHLRPVEVAGSTHMVAGDESLTTGLLQPDLANLELELLDEEMAHGGFMVTSLLSQPSAAVIIDADGDYVWAHQLSVDWDSLVIPRVHLSEVGPWVVYHAAATALVGEDDESVDRLLVRVSLDGAEEQTVSVRSAHHDFAELGDGSCAVLVRDRQSVDGEMIEGDQVVRAHFDGRTEQLWTIWDYTEYDPDTVEEIDGFGWSHANAIQVEGDDLMVSLSNLDSIVRFDRSTGQETWTLGGLSSDFATPTGDTILFQRQHQFKLADDRIVVFDNGLVGNLVSRVVEYELDEQAGQAALVWEHRNEPVAYTPALGDVWQLPGGDTLVTWSSQGQVDQVTDAGEIVWQLRADLGAGIGYLDWHEELVIAGDVGDPWP